MILSQANELNWTNTEFDAARRTWCPSGVTRTACRYWEVDWLQGDGYAGTGGGSFGVAMVRVVGDAVEGVAVDWGWVS